MKKYSLLLIAFLAFMFAICAQNIIVTGGPGRVNNTTVIKGQPFTARVTGLNGTPQRWSVGIGTINGQFIFNTSSTTISNAIVDRAISGTTALISVGATNGNGVARYLTVQEPEVCESNLRFLEGVDCSLLAAVLIPVPVGATSYAWSVSPSTPFTNNGSSIVLDQVNPLTTYNFSVTITGGSCNGETITGSYRTGRCDDIIPFDSGLDGTQGNQGTNSGMRLSPNPVDEDDLTVQFAESASSFDISIFSSEGQSLDKVDIQRIENQATIDISGLKPGTYYLKSVDKNGNQVTQRFLVK